MQRVRQWAARWPLVVTPALVFVVGCAVDIAVNAAVRGDLAERFLPEVCGMTVGLLTVLTFARRRVAYIGTAAMFVLAEMIVIALPLDLPVRLALGAACLVTTAACLGVFFRVRWATVRPAGW